MGIFDRIFGSGEASSLNDTAKDHIENPEKSNILRDPESLKGKVNVDRRAEIIDTYYDDVSTDDARFIAETLKEYMETYDLEKYEAKNRIEDRVGLDRDRVSEIFETERASVQKCNEIREKQGGSSTLSFEWACAKEPCSPICAEVEQATAGGEGAVSATELQELLRDKAEEYADEGGTPERMDHWVPHHKCTAFIQTFVD